MDRVVEIITGRERRRHWSVAEKLSLVAETQEPGSSVRGVTVRHGLCRSLLYTWRRQMREGGLRPEPEMPAFLPVHMIEAPRTIATLQRFAGRRPARSKRLFRFHPFHDRDSKSRRMAVVRGLVNRSSII